ncbi:MAG: ArsR/SmtB family transcription factor [Candidatus Hodarchaeales archaeon]
MATYSPKPGQAIEVIKAFADTTRRRILLLLSKASPRGLTASALADHEAINKSIPTILHHLEKLQELGLIYYEMEKIGKSERLVKHWKIKYKTFVIKIDTESLELEDFDPREYIIHLFEKHKAAGGIITESFGSSKTLDSIKQDLLDKRPGITDREIQIIHNILNDPLELQEYLESWILKAFRESGGALRLDFQRFGAFFALDGELRRIMIERLINSGKFFWEYTDLQRIALRPEFLKEP